MLPVNGGDVGLGYPCCSPLSRDALTPISSVASRNTELKTNQSAVKEKKDTEWPLYSVFFSFAHARRRGRGKAESKKAGCSLEDALQFLDPP